ncbi:hypothetical protein DFH08DRAFT_92154 [Mycena albidolilacea]|uniref:Uncharacterized protein n=1 Tax=Mycena albidolilacea TaxID=1033008 RepID=A0AAD7A9J1_9AGAR|nr:hypothetical protein DFH08DRAFT_92154 [Mycena albidolilacea]
MIHIPKTRRRPGALEWLKERTIGALATVFRSRGTAAEKSRCITLASCFGRRFPRVITTAILNDSRTGPAVPHKMPSDSFLCGPAEFASTALSSASHLKPMKRSTHWAARSRTQGVMSRVYISTSIPPLRAVSICTAGGDADTALAVLGTSRGFGDILLHRAQRGRQQTGLYIDDPRSSLLQLADVGPTLRLRLETISNSKVAAITWECRIGSPSRNSTNIPVLVEIRRWAFWTTAKSRSWPRRWQFTRAHWLIDSRGHPGPISRIS